MFANRVSSTFGKQVGVYWNVSAWAPVVLMMLAFTCHPATALEKVTFATNWKAQAEHGGFYQALADGTYEEYGLDVTIRPGGPMVNNRALLTTGRIEFLMGSNLIQSFDAVKQGLPSLVVGATFQRDAHCLISHPGEQNDTWAKLKTAPLLVGNAGRYTYFRWLKNKHGFSELNVRPYTFNLAPFLANKQLVQQGFATAEPKRIEDVLKRPPHVFLLADHGWSTYSTLIVTRKDLVNEKPELVQRFVNASIIGWVNYLYGDHAAAHRLIQKDNPDMPESQLEYSVQAMRRLGIVDSGDALTRGICAISPDRVRDFFETMVATEVYEAGELDPAEAYVTDFVNQGVGLDLKKRLLAKATTPEP